MASLWRLHLVGVVDKASHLRSIICLRPKKGRLENLGHRQSKHKNSFWGCKIPGKIPPPLAWGASSVSYLLSNIYWLDSWKRNKRNRVILSKTMLFLLFIYLFIYMTWTWAILKRKNKKIYSIWNWAHKVVRLVENVWWNRPYKNFHL